MSDVKNGGKIIKKSPITKFTETFFGGTLKDAGSFLVNDIIVPKIKDMVRDGVSGALDRLLYGDTKNGYYNGYSGYTTPGITILSPGKTNYAASSSTSLLGSRGSRTPETLVFSNKAYAEDVLRKLCEDLSAYKRVDVAAYYEYANKYIDNTTRLITSTDNKWGWYDLSMARIRDFVGADNRGKPTRGFIIQFPPTQPI